MIILDKGGVKAISEKLWQIRSEREHHTEREELCKKRKEKCGYKIRVNSDKSSVEQSIASSVVQINAEQREDLTG